MGVTGLWRLVEPAGKPVPVETLENKVLAVDISIWLHQVVKGYQDAKGAPLPNAHLIGLFQRLCKLLYFRIKPVFVFDGAFPELKKETIAKRQDNKNRYHSESARLKRELAVLFSKKTAIGSLLGKQISPTKKTNTANKDYEDLFKLPALPQREESESESSDDEDTSSGSIVDLHSVDLQSDNFKNLPTKEKYDLLLELKETRKMNSWGKLETLPKKSDNFSDFQMQRLLKRRKVQECIEETEKEMGDIGMSMNDLESLLNEEGIDTKIERLPTRRIASNNNTRYLLINNVREALAKNKERRETENKQQASVSTDITASLPATEKSSVKHDELEDDLQRAIAMSLECVDDPNTSGCQSKTDDSWTSVLTDTDYSDASDSEGELEQPDISTAKAYIMQYCDYTHSAIEKIVAPRLKSRKTKPKPPVVNQILEEINKEKSIIIDNVALSSSDEEYRPEICYSNNASTTSIELEKLVDTENEIDENVESTQASVMFVDNVEPDVIDLDSSIDEFIEEKESLIVREKTMNAKNIESINDEIQEVPEQGNKAINTTELPEQGNKAINATEESGYIKYLESSDTDEDFEEVPEVEDKKCKPVVELTLTMGDVPNDEDDIFADVFSPISHSNSTKESNTAEILTNSILEKNVPKKEPYQEEIQCHLKSSDSAMQHTKKTGRMGMKKDLKKDFSSMDEICNTNVSFAPKELAEEPVQESSIRQLENEKQTDSYRTDDNMVVIESIPKNVAITTNNEESNNEAGDNNEPEKEKQTDSNRTDDNVVLIESIPKNVAITTNNEESNNEAGDNNKPEKEIQTDSNRTDDNVVLIESIPKNVAITTNNDESNKKGVDNNKPGEANKEPKAPLTTEKLTSMVEEIRNEEQELIQEKGRLDRIGRNITEQMTKEAQELLQIFGIPYIVAPMEAEAQCAFLESVKLTDGTITDDSDIWLFGGQTVYKNFFNQKKHVLQYISERIEKSFNLNREQLILLALLVGSDYTTGIAGVGPVTAMEILASFPFNKKQVLAETSKQVRYAKLLDGLKEFKLWVKAGKRTDNTSLKKKLRNVTITDDFPSVRVVQAYLEPNVETSEEKLTWGDLDITVLRDYAKSKFGWSQQKFDEIIKPVLARMKERKNQKTVTDYFKRKVEFQSLEDQMTKRVKAAVQKMAPGGQSAEIDSTEGEKVKTTKKRTKVVKNPTENEAGPSKPKQRQKQVDLQNVVKVVSEVKDGKTGYEINIPKTDRFQEIIPQREKDKQHLFENKMKAIEIFRKTTIDRKRKPKKRKPNLPKDKANLSESSSSD